LTKFNIAKKLTVGIDASRNRSGGAKAHLLGILTQCNPERYGIDEIHVWAYKSLLDQLPDYSWLVKHNPPALELSLFSQLWWQAFSLAREARSVNCDILFATDASTLSFFSPLIVLSQDMLSYEPGAMRFFGFGFDRLRLVTILLIQNLAFKRSKGVIFLTRYAGNVIQKSCGTLPRVAYIPHGVGEEFKNTQPLFEWPKKGERSINCVYVSNAEMYKHQWLVVSAIEFLRKSGYDIYLTLIGGGTGLAQIKIERQISISDPAGDFVRQLDFLPHQELPFQLTQADIFVFASSCENMPVTLIEGMAVGLPIASSDRGPMPEVLEDGGLYFNPEDPGSIASAIEKIICDPILRSCISKRALDLSKQYSWSRCSDETFKFISETYWTNLR